MTQQEIDKRIRIIEASQELYDAINYYFDVLKETRGKNWDKTSDHTLKKMLDAMDKVNGQETEKENRAIHVKSLMLNGTFIDSLKLSKGLYATNEPVIYPHNQDKESLDAIIEMVRGEGSLYLHNFKKCELVDAVVIPL